MPISLPASASPGSEDGLSASVREKRPHLRQAEIQDLDSPVFGEKDVLGLQVPVRDPLCMRRRQSFSDRNRDL